jgi:hypothetical protein
MAAPEKLAHDPNLYAGIALGNLSGTAQPQRSRSAFHRRDHELETLGDDMEQVKGFTRRQTIGAAGATGMALLIGGVLPRGGAVGPDEAMAATCVMTPAKTEGPYFVDEKLNRSDVREGQAGVKLTLTMFVFDSGNDCAPVQGAQIDIWHANANGLYSDESANNTVGQTWLRGFQTTDADGKATFTTVYPGWYSGRAVHIHFKVRSSGLEFTSQLFFTDEMNRAVFQQSPYSSRGNPDTTDGSDNIYGTDGSSLLLQPQSDGSGGYTADFSVGVSGGSSGDTGTATGTTDSTVNASLKSLRSLRTAAGTRQVRMRIKNGEPIALKAKMTRSGRTLASKSGTLAAGTHTVKLTLPSRVKAGAAAVKLTMTDALGNTKTVMRTVHVGKVRG